MTQTQDEASALLTLAHSLGAVRLGQCPGCAAWTSCSPSGHVTLCYACTLDEIGHDPQLDAQRRQLKMTWPAYLSWRSEMTSRARRIETWESWFEPR